MNVPRPNPGTVGERKRTWISLGFAVVAAAATMAPVVGANYVTWDDHDFIFRSPFADYGTLESFRRILLAEAYSDRAYYPVFRASWFFDYVLFRKDPHLSHLLNLVLHLVNVVLVWQCVRLLLMRSTSLPHRRILLAAAFAATIFGIHPVNVEPVAWVSGRKVELAFLFSMSAFLLLLSPRGGAVRYVFAVPCFALGVLSNAVAIGFALVFAAWWAMVARVGFLKVVLLSLPFLALVVVSGVARLSLRGPERDLVATQESWGEQMGESLSGRARETLDVVYPTGLVAVYPSAGVQTPFWTRDSFAGLFLTAASALLIVWGWVRGTSGRPRVDRVDGVDQVDGESSSLPTAHRPLPTACCPLPTLLAFALAWYLLALSPAFLHHIAQADRHLYCSGVGLFMAAGVLFALAFERLRLPGRTVLIASCCVAGLTLSILAFRQTTYWKDNARLYSHAVEATENNHVAHCNLGNVFLEEKNDLQEAMAHYREAVRIRPDYPEAESNLAATLILLDRPQEALPHLETALRLRPDYAHAWYNLANLRKDAGHTQESIAAYEQVLRLTPDDAKVHYEFGALLASAGRTQEAIAHLEESLRLKPDYAEAKSELQNLLR